MNNEWDRFMEHLGDSSAVELDLMKENLLEPSSKKLISVYNFVRRHIDTWEDEERAAMEAWVEKSAKRYNDNEWPRYTAIARKILELFPD